MIVLVTNKLIMRSKFLKMLFWISISWSKCQPPDQYYWTNSTSWTNTIWTSWSKSWSPEKVEFWSHEIQPHDHFPIVSIQLFQTFSVKDGGDCRPFCLYWWSHSGSKERKIRRTSPGRGNQQVSFLKKRWVPLDGVPSDGVPSDGHFQNFQVSLSKKSYLGFKRLFL